MSSVPVTSITLDMVLDLLADRIAARLNARPVVDEKIPIANVKAHGAPSSRWLSDRARHGQIVVRGPRGARYVLRSELDALLDASIARHRKCEAPPESTTTLEDAVTAGVAKLAARVARRTLEDDVRSAIIARALSGTMSWVTPP